MFNKIKAGINWIKQNPILCIAYVCVGIGLLVLVGFLYLINETYNIGGKLTPEEMSQTGQVGDFIGGVIGSVWALAGVFLYFSALKLQQQELKSQRVEMATNQKLLDQQLFENTFFNLLKTQDSIRDSINARFYHISLDKTFKLAVTSDDVNGMNFFNRSIIEYRNLYNFVSSHNFKKASVCEIDEEVGFQLDYFYDAVNDVIIDNEHYDDVKLWAINQYIGILYGSNENTFKTVHESKDEREYCAYAYWLFFYKYEFCLGHYCRHFYNIIKYLDDYKQKLLSQLDSQSVDYEQEKKRINDKIHHYFSFAQASLSSSELVMLYYNVLLFPKAEELYKRYNIFENMHLENLINKKHAAFFDGINIKSVDRFKNRIWYK